MMHHDVDGKLMDSTALMVVDGLLINFLLRLDIKRRKDIGDLTRVKVTTNK